MSWRRPPFASGRRMATRSTVLLGEVQLALPADLSGHGAGGISGLGLEPLLSLEAEPVPLRSGESKSWKRIGPGPLGPRSRPLPVPCGLLKDTANHSNNVFELFT